MLTIMLDDLRNLARFLIYLPPQSILIYGAIAWTVAWFAGWPRLGIEIVTAVWVLIAWAADAHRRATLTEKDPVK